jgi:hypothetical protein
VPLFALGFSEPSWGGEPLRAAWTADGRYFVHTDTHLRWTGDAIAERAEITTVVDVRTHGKTVYRVSYLQIAGSDELRAQFAALPDLDAFDQWLAEHPVLAASHGMTSPVGPTRAVLPEGETWLGVAPDGAHGHAAAGWNRQVALEVRDDDHVWSTLDLSVAPITPSGEDVHLWVLWAPTGARVAFAFQHEVSGPPGTLTRYAVVDAAASVEVLAPASLPAAELAAAIDAVERSGHPVASSAVAPQVRSTHLVYAPASLVPVAARVAMALPGGCEVAPLTWATDADLVVALGAP